MYVPQGGHEINADILSELLQSCYQDWFVYIRYTQTVEPSRLRRECPDFHASVLSINWDGVCPDE